MTFKDDNWFGFAAGLTIAAIILVIVGAMILLTGCASTQRVENLEKRVALLYEVTARKRPMSAELWESYSTPEQTTYIDDEGNYKIRFPQDDQDRENLAARAEAIQRKQAEDAAKSVEQPSQQDDADSDGRAEQVE